MNASPPDLNELTATEIVQGISEKAFTAEAVARACLERIELRDPKINAWESIDPIWTIEQARRIDKGVAGGLLAGVPLGVKDVLDTADFPTQMGSPLYAGHRPRFDASCVALARAAGAVVMGKTVTAEFAGSAPARTRNPHRPEHTPGGSSSGSGAAVADHMVPMALGTQTGGSVLRPAAFCGVIGFKPTFGTYDTAGMKPAAVSLDTIGLMARSVGDIALFHAALTDGAWQPPIALDRVPRIGVCRTHLWHTATPDTVRAIEDTVAEASKAGASIRDIQVSEDFAQLTSQRGLINMYERAHAMAAEWNADRQQLSALLQATCESGFAIRREDYLNAARAIATARRQASALFEGVDVLLTPVTPGEAPAGHAHAGDPRFQELWTLLHLPSITLPTHCGSSGLPVGVQLVAPHHQEARLFAVAHWLLELMGSVEPTAHRRVPINVSGALAPLQKKQA